MQKVIAIIGPTGVGKTALSVNLAKKLNTEIISGDSIQVYRGLDIGSAKVTPDEMQGIKHHLIDVKNLEENYSVYDFQSEGRRLINEISSKGMVPIICGGTGLYIKALLYDYSFDSTVQVVDTSKYDNQTNEELYEILKVLDPKSCEKIHMNNRRRVIRAIEIARAGDKNKSDIESEQEHKMIYDAFVIGLTADRDFVYSRINQRVDVMINNGLLNEINNVVSKYQNAFELQGMRGIGYKEFEPYVLNKCSLDEAIDSVKTHSRQFAKRQYTWFNNQMNVQWYNIQEDGYLDKLNADLEAWLNGVD